MTRKQLTRLALLSLVGVTTACPLHRGGAPDPSSGAPNNQRRSIPSELAKTAIQDVSIFDGHQFTNPTTLCMNGGWIVDIGKCRDPAATVNGTGKFLIPGLIDSHLHLQDVQSLEYLTSYGITTAMHMNCMNYTQCHINTAQPGLADFLWAGHSSVGNGSHHAATDPTRPKDTLVYPDTNVTQFVEYQFNNGSTYHKITAELFGPSTEQQIEMVRTAHEQYRRQTMTHAADVHVSTLAGTTALATT